ncbi:MAG: hypothetical protein AAFX01_13745 [Cyanobacteria bacterium J06638_28]
MKKRIFQGLGLLGFNVVSGMVALAAFVIFLLKQDPIFAAVIALPVIPAILLQPWFPVFFLIPGGPLLAPILTTIVSMLIYGLLDQQRKLERFKLRFARLIRPRNLAYLGLLILCWLAICYGRYVDFPAFYRGVPQTWALSAAVEEMALSSSEARYYCISAFIDSEWLWQAHLSEPELNGLMETLGMQTIAVDQVSAAVQKMPPYWWQPTLSEPTRIFATSNFPMEGRGPDGWHALATWNPQDTVLHMWIKDNF